MTEKKITLYIKAEKPKDKKKLKLKKRLEFTQKVVYFTLPLPFLWVTFSYILAMLEKPNALEELSIACVSLPIVAIVGYVTQNSARSVSYNKMQSEIVKAETTQEKPQEDDMMKNRRERGC